MRPLLFSALFLACITSQAIADECTGSPADAVMTLPAPLDQWGQLICSPYGHVIAARDGWIWSRMGAYSPVFVPSQMVRNDPASIGNQSYFTRIALTTMTLVEAEPAIAEMRRIFPKDSTPTTSYRLDVTSVSGRSLQLVFLEYEQDKRKDIWGIWCRNGSCDPASLFMLLDMNKKKDGSAKP